MDDETQTGTLGKNTVDILLRSSERGGVLNLWRGGVPRREVPMRGGRVRALPSLRIFDSDLKFVREWNWGLGSW